jgi:hypothetical protein
MDVVTLILACSLYPDDSLVRALISVQSQDNPYFVGDLATLKTSDRLTSPDAAMVETEAISRREGRPAVGLLGIPVAWARRFDKETRELFDPCTNIAVGTAMLSEFEAECVQVKAPSKLRDHSGHNRSKTSRSCVIRKFAEGLGLTGAPAALLAHLSKFSPSVARSIASAPVFPPGALKGDSTNPEESRNDGGE